MGKSRQRRRLRVLARAPRPQPFNIMNLPAELVLSVSDHLDNLTLTNLACTCATASSLLAPIRNQRAAHEITHHTRYKSDTPNRRLINAYNSSLLPELPSNGKSPLHLFAAKRDARNLTKLLEAYTAKYGAEETTIAVNRRDYKDLTPLLSAIVSTVAGIDTRSATVAVLLKHGATPEPACSATHDPERGMCMCVVCRYPTPLMFAVGLKQYAVVKLLLERGIDAGVVLHQHIYIRAARTALEVAVVGRDMKAPKMVLEMGSVGDVMAEMSVVRWAVDARKWGDVAKVVREVIGDGRFSGRPGIGKGVVWDVEGLQAESMAGELMRIRYAESRIRGEMK